jgi:hypothetical protein
MLSALCGKHGSPAFAGECEGAAPLRFKSKACEKVPPGLFSQDQRERRAPFPLIFSRRFDHHF